MNPELDELTWVAEHGRQVADPDGPATDRARMALMEQISTERAPRRLRLPWMALAAGVTAAAAAAVVLVAGGTAGSPATAPGGGAGFTSPGDHTSFVLMTLAHSAAQSPALPGDATLVHRTSHNTDPGHPAWNYSGYDLYEDNGDYFFGQTLGQLRQALAKPAAPETVESTIADAAAAAVGDTPQQAASAVYEAAPGPPDPTATQYQKDNRLWVNIVLALEAGDGRPDVRAGLLLAASALPAVTVTDTTFAGQPALDITNAQFPDGYSETFTVDPQTGVLVHFHGGGTPSGASVGAVADTTYQASRVTTPGLTPAH